MRLTSPKFDHDEVALVQRCLDSGWVTQGPMVQEFEALMAQHHQARHALATTSCTAALHLATLALDLGPGDEVVVPAFTWITSANCAEYVGASVRFADVDPQTCNLSPAALEAAITPATRAVVAVHLFGLAADMDAINAIADRHGLAVIEDAACAIGSTYRGRSVGTLGDLGCFSFHPRKVITTGEGGMVTTNHPDLAEKINSLRNHGATGLPADERERPLPWSMASHDVLGYNLRMADILAAVGIAQMAKLDGLLAERRHFAQCYRDRLATTFILPPDDAGHTYQSFVVSVPEGGRERRNGIMQSLDRAGIQTRPGTHAVHCLGYYKAKYGLQSGDFPAAAALADTTIALPLFPGMTEQDIDMVVDAIKAS